MTPFEIQLRDAPDRAAVVRKMLDGLYKKDADGLYVMTGTRMKEGAYEGFSPLCHPELRDRIRMLIHSRYETIPPHRTDFASITYVYSGYFIVTFPPPGRTVELKQGQLMLMNAGVAHSFTVGADDIVMSIQVEPAFANMTLIYRLDNGQDVRSSDNSGNSNSGGNGENGGSSNGGVNGVFSFLTRMFSGQISAFSYMSADCEDEGGRALCAKTCFASALTRQCVPCHWLKDT